MFQSRHRAVRITGLALVATTMLVASCSSDHNAPLAGAEEADLLPVVEEGRWGFMNRAGHLAIAPEFDAAWPFSGNRAMVRVNNRYGYIDRGGILVIPPRFDDAWYFNEGLAPVQIGDRWVAIDTLGQIQFESAFEPRPVALGEKPQHAFELNRYRQDDQYGFRSPSGETVVAPNFDDAWHFSEGLARVMKDGKWGFIDRNGSWVVEPQFDIAWDFEGGLARVKIDNRLGYINAIGEYVWAPTE